MTSCYTEQYIGFGYLEITTGYRTQLVVLKEASNKIPLSPNFILNVEFSRIDSVFGLHTFDLQILR